MQVGFEKILLIYNVATYPTADVISTYLYRVGIQTGNFSYAAMVGLFESVIGLGAGSRHQRPLPSSRWVRPVVTAEIAAPPAPAGPAKKRKAGAWPPRSRGYKVFRVVNAIILTLVVARGAAAVPEPARAVVQQREVHHTGQRQPVAARASTSPRTST